MIEIILQDALIAGLRALTGVVLNFTDVSYRLNKRHQIFML